MTPKKQIEALRFENAILAERLRGVEAQLKMAQDALMAAVSQPAVAYSGAASNGPLGPGFQTLAQAAMANADVDDDTPPAPPKPPPPKPQWFRADGTDPAKDPTPTAEAA